MNKFVLAQVFNKHVTKEGEVIYWRDCILQSDMVQGEQGYVWLYPDGSYFHTYSTPENL